MRAHAYRLLFALFFSYALTAEELPPPLYSFSLFGEYVRVNPATFWSSGVEGETLRYHQTDISFSYTHPFCSTFGLVFGANWVQTLVDWPENPDFNETLFNYIGFSTGGFIKPSEEWMWTATATAFLDTEILSLVDYALYQVVLNGQFICSKKLELDFGFILELGLNKEKIWPILGFVYSPTPEWKLSAVYPVNVSLEYKILPCLKAAAALRFLRNRHRVLPEEPNSQGIFEYQDWGGEGDLIYAPYPWLSIKGYVGSTFDGYLKMTNRHDEDAHYFKYGGAFYSGVSALLSY